MTDAERQQLLRLADWKPPHGLISAYFDVERGDRGGGWRLALKDRVKDLRGPDDHEGRLAFRETADRILERFDGDNEPPPGLAQVGFVEVARNDGAEDWSSLQIPLRETVVEYGRRPALRPLVGLLERGRARPVIAVSSERVRGWIWSRGRLAVEKGWGDELAIFDGRERKGARPQDPARGGAVSSSGHDQYGQKLEENRKRFLHAVARRMSEDRRLVGAELIAIGEAPYLSEFADAVAPGVQVQRLEGPDVIGEPDAAILERVGPEIESLTAKREAGLAGAAVDAAMASGGHGTVGADETSAALAEGRVDRLVLDCARPFRAEELSASARDAAEDDGHLDGAELMIELALRTSADVTLVAGEVSETLDEHGGAAALLRY
ncbi:MAG: hypothetical protein ACRDKV_10700 [Solirubrobacterales bacterium]